MAQLKGMDVYRWPVIKALAPVYAWTVILVFLPLYLNKSLQDLAQSLYGEVPWLRYAIDSLHFVGLGYLALNAFSLTFGWQSAITRRTHKRVEKALRQGHDDS